MLVLGASGMLGNAVLRLFCQSPGFSVVGSARSAKAVNLLPTEYRRKVISGVDVEDTAELERLFSRTRPAVVINCVGIVKQLPEANDPLVAISINSMLPHRLRRLCKQFGSRLVQISTDCVFAGTRGGYRE